MVKFRVTHRFLCVGKEALDAGRRRVTGEEARPKSMTVT